jgi:hypothetical protein
MPTVPAAPSVPTTGTAGTENGKERHEVAERTCAVRLPPLQARPRRDSLLAAMEIDFQAISTDELKSRIGELRRYL